MKFISKYSPEIFLLLSVSVSLFFSFIATQEALPLGIGNNDIHSNMLTQISGLIKSEYVIAYFSLIAIILILRFIPIKFDIRPILIVCLLFIVSQFLEGMQNEAKFGLNLEVKAGTAYYLVIFGILVYTLLTRRNSEYKFLYFLPLIFLFMPTCDLVYSSFRLATYSLFEFLKPLLIFVFTIIFIIFQIPEQDDKPDAILITKSGILKYWKNSKE